MDYETARSHAENLLVHFRRVEQLKKEVLAFPSIDLNLRQMCDLELLLNRAFYPLEGYLSQEDYESVLSSMRLNDGTIWPLPKCLDVDQGLAERMEAGACLGLRDPEGFLLAVLKVQEVWSPDKAREAEVVFGTADPKAHPGVRRFLEETGDYYVGGILEGLHLPQHYDFLSLRLPPSETHRRFAQNGWRRVIGFQSERPLHCAHKEMIQGAAREVGASIFLQPAVGHGVWGRVDHFTRVRCFQEFAAHFPKNIIDLGLLPLALLHAGPREALLQAIVRRNFGCTHFMVAEDQADPFTLNNGQDRFYPRHKAQELVQSCAQETGIEMVPLKPMVYVEERSQYLPVDEVPAGTREREITSSELERRLELDIEIPEWFSFPEVVRELRIAHPPRHKQGFTLFLTGLSGAGKSTLAKVLFVRFMEMRDRPVTLLDGDIVRKNLSSELNFSKGHRELNVRRIGFVASEITKNGGIAICAPIAPYEESRRANRELIEAYGGYVEVFISTPLEVCERRDRKGLYAKARSGMVKGVTGIDDPYIPPSDPELVIDTSEMTPNEAAQEVLLYLEEQKYVC